MALDKRQLKEAVLTYTEVTSSTTLEIGKGYIANLNSGGVPLELTLPESFNIGDEITIVGKGSEGWVIKSNALAAAQAIVSSQGSSSFSNEDSITLASSVSSTDSLYLVAAAINSVFNISEIVGAVIGSESFGKIYLGSEGQFRYNETGNQLEYKDTTAGSYTALSASSPSTPKMVIGIDSISKDFILPLGSTQDISLNNYGLLNTKNSSWSVAEDMNTSRQGLGGAGTQNASLAFGGGYSPFSDATEKFNGTAWSTSGNLSTPNFSLGGIGIQNAALAFGGYPATWAYPTNSTEKFNGTIWSSAASLIASIQYPSGAGTLNAALSFGGGESSWLKSTEKYNGTAWTEDADLNTGRNQLAGCGTQNAALAFGGYLGAVGDSSVTEKYDSMSWSTSADMNFGRNSLAGSGTQNAALAIGGYRTGIGYHSTPTEKFNGTAWTIFAGLINERGGLGGAGTQNAALSFGGYDGYTQLAFTEKYSSEVPISAKFFIIGDTTITETDGSDITLTSDDYLSVEYDVKQYINEDGSNELTDLTTLGKEGNDNYWSISGELNTGRSGLGASGTQSASLAFGGGGYLASAEKFNGTTWSETSDMSVARSGLGGAGTQNAALSFGGRASHATTVTEKFNTSGWSTSGDLTTPNTALGAAGTQNAALCIGGNYSSISEKFNGSVWSEAAGLNTLRQLLGGAGTQNAALCIGGKSGSDSTGGVPLASTERFDGTTWSYTGELNEAREGTAGSGTQNSAISFGSTTLKNTEKFDGFVWSLTGNLNALGSLLGGAGSQAATLAIGGYYYISGWTHLTKTEKRISSQTPSTTNYGMALQGEFIIAI